MKENCIHPYINVELWVASWLTEPLNGMMILTLRIITPEIGFVYQVY